MSEERLDWVQELFYAEVAFVLAFLGERLEALRLFWSLFQLMARPLLLDFYVQLGFLVQLGERIEASVPSCSFSQLVSQVQVQVQESYSLWTFADQPFAEETSVAMFPSWEEGAFVEEAMAWF
jgi:hypothetical protein